MKQFYNGILTFVRKHELVTQSAVAFIVRIVGALSGFLFSLVLARVLGAEQAGYYFLAFTLVSVLAVFGRVGLDQTVLRFSSTHLLEDGTSQVTSVLTKSLLLAGVASAFLSLFLYVSAELVALKVFNKSELVDILKNMSLGTVGLGLSTLVAMSLQAIRKVVSSIVVANIAVNILLAFVLLICSDLNVTEVARYYSVITVLVFFLSIFYWWCIRPKKVCGNVAFITWRKIFSSCMPLWIVMITAQLIQWSGQLIAGAWVEPEELAQLAIAQRTAMLTSFILVAVNLVVGPRFAAMHKQGDIKGIERVALFSVRLMILFAIPIVLFMLIYSRFLMGLFGDDLEAGAHYLQILVVGQFVNVATGSVGYLLSMTGNERAMRNTMLIVGPFAVLVGLILVPLYGAVGSAVATAVAIAAQNLLAAFYVRQRLGINMFAVWRRA